MVDPKFIRENPDRMKAIINSGRSNPEMADVDAWLELDAKRGELITKRDELNQRKNELAKIGKQGGNIEEIREKGQQIKKDTAELEESLQGTEAEWQKLLDWMPNVPHPDMPEGKGEEDNPVIKAWTPDGGYIDEDKLGKVGDTAPLMPDQSIHWKTEDFEPTHHLDLGEALGVIDNEQGAKVSGSRFTYLFGDLARLQFAVQQLLFSELLERGFNPIIPPLLVKEPSLYGTSHFPEQVDQVYQIRSDYLEDQDQSLYLVGSSEPANFSFFMGKTLDEAQLPVKVFAYTPCFRSEAGSWGRDTKGIKRLHQFDKIEMNVVCKPDQSDEVFDELLSINEWLLQKLELPYHLVLKCTGDAGYHASAKQIDPEVWLPGQKEFMEVMTDTNTTDFQARRMNIKYKKKEGGKEYVHTVNDTGVAMGRMLIAIMDNYQQADGSIAVPQALVQYMGKEVISKT